MNGMNEGILIKFYNEPLNGHTKSELITMLISALKERVSEAYIFGSVATNTFTSDSDVDIMLVVETKLGFIDRPKEFLDIMDIVPNMDILVYTPLEFNKLTTNPTIGFWESVTKTMEKII
ncbi:MAG: nucleotidyltransferase domain-containing protein [Oligoflexia bacterium]|nr:nucleotidyltransferase domain-containing protein [Oligoflexia bacterium]